MMTNQEFDKKIKNRLDFYQPVYQKVDWLDMVKRLQEHDRNCPTPSNELVDYAVKHLN